MPPYLCQNESGQSESAPRTSGLRASHLPVLVPILQRGSWTPDATLVLSLVFQLCLVQRPALRDATVNVRFISGVSCFRKADSGHVFICCSILPSINIDYRPVVWQFQGQANRIEMRRDGAMGRQAVTCSSPWGMGIPTWTSTPRRGERWLWMWPAELSPHPGHGGRQLWGGK